MQIILLVALWVCGAKSPPPVKYYSVTGGSRQETINSVLKICGNEDCELVGCKQINPEEER